MGRPKPTAPEALLRPYRSLRAFVDKLCAEFGWELASMLFSAYFGVKGFLYQLATRGMLPYAKELLGIDGAEYAKMYMVAMTPWGMKAWIGCLSDVVPISGYHKRYYVVGASVLGAAACLGLATAPASHTLATLLFFATFLQQATVDLLCEGKYAEKMAEKPETGPMLVSWVWGTYQSGGLLAALVMGPLIWAAGPRGIWWVAVPFAAQVLAPALKGWLPEERLPPRERRWNTSLVRSQPRILLLALLMAAAALSVAGTELLWGSEGASQAAVVMSLSVALIAVGFWALPRPLAMGNAYLFLCEATYIQIDGAMDYFYTADEECLPGGPAFSWVYYITYAQVVGCVGGWLGVVCFQSFMSKWKFRAVFWVSTVVRVAASVFDIIIVKRWNTQVGVPDRWAYMLGDAVVYSVAYMLNFMPGVVLTSKLCPSNLEATVYALLAGFQNFGQTVARSLGVFLMVSFGIRTTTKDGGGEGCDFSRLPQLLVLCHMLLPMIMVPLSFVMLPNKRMDEALELEGAAGEVGGGKSGVQLAGEEHSLLQGTAGVATYT